MKTLTFDEAIEILTDLEPTQLYDAAYQIVKAEVAPLCKSPTDGADADAFHEFLFGGYFAASRFYPGEQINPQRLARIWDQWGREWGEE